MSGPKVSYASLNSSLLNREKEKAMFDYNVNVCSRYSDAILPAIQEFKKSMECLDAIPCDKDDNIEKEKIVNSIAAFELEFREIGEKGEMVKEYSKATPKKRLEMRNEIPNFQSRYRDAKRWKGSSYSEDLFFVEYFNEYLTLRAASVRSSIKEINNKIKAFETRVVENKILKNLSSSTYYFAFENAKKLYSAKEYVDKTNEALSEIKEMYLSEKLNSKLEELKRKSISIDNGEFIHNFYQISILPFLKECREYNEFYSVHNVEYETLRISCEILANELNVEIKKMELSPEAIEYYASKREELTKLAIEARQLAYIKESLDNAMTELGYDIIGQKESTNRNGEKFQNYLFNYGEGTVVNVTFSTNGQITMELGGVDTIDRLPEYKESQKLVESMHMFCTDYSRIEQKLKEKGINNQRLSMFPPDEDFAQIINISEFEMNQEVAKFSSVEPTTSQTKYMYYGDNE